MAVLIVVVAVTLSVSAACSLFEAILYSARVTTLEAAIEGGRHRHSAQVMLDMKRDIAVPTSAILILNTIANTAGATVAGMYAADVLGTALVPAFTIVLTLSILFLSELLPKTFGATHWQRMWPFIVWPLTMMRRGLAPMIWVTRKFVSFVTADSSSTAITEEEIKAMVRLGGRSGELTSAELRLINAVFSFDDLTCREIMLPRNDVDILDPADPMSETLDTIRRTRHTRYPLCDGSLDDVFGVVHLKDLVGQTELDTFDLQSIARPLRRVPGTMQISRLLREMQSSRQHMALVVDEYGTVTGLVTLENVIEQIVGAVQDEFDVELPDVVPDASGAYLVDGRTPIRRINRELKCDLHAPDIHTLSGLIVNELDRLPREGDVVELQGLVAEVLEVQRGRARKVRLRTGESSGD